jgi:hypothetical protein
VEGTFPKFPSFFYKPNISVIIMEPTEQWSVTGLVLYPVMNSNPVTNLEVIRI